MNKDYRMWHSKLVNYWKNKYGYSEEYCDAIAVIRRNYYPLPIEEVPFR